MAVCENTYEWARSELWMIWVWTILVFLVICEWPTHKLWMRWVWTLWDSNFGLCKMKNSSKKFIHKWPSHLTKDSAREHWRGKYHCTVDLLFDQFGLVSFANKNKNCQFSYSWFQTSQTGGQWYSDTSPFNVPWFSLCCQWMLLHFFATTDIPG